MPDSTTMREIREAKALLQQLATVATSYLGAPEHAAEATPENQSLLDGAVQMIGGVRAEGRDDSRANDDELLSLREVGMTLERLMIVTDQLETTRSFYADLQKVKGLIGF